MMNEKKLSQMILKLHDRAEAAKYDGDSSPPYQEVEMLNFHDEESVVHTVLEDFYAVGALADELTHGFHMEERGYIDRTEVNSRLIAFARELERMRFCRHWKAASVGQTACPGIRKRSLLSLSGRCNRQYSRHTSMKMFW